MSHLAFLGAFIGATMAPNPLLSMNETRARCSASPTLPSAIAVEIRCLKLGLAAGSMRPRLWTKAAPASCAANSMFMRLPFRIGPSGAGLTLHLRFRS